jgi:hypothetical protein
MATVLSEVEATPASYPAVTHWPRPSQAGMDDPDPTVSPALAWRRIEEWTAHRWSARTVAWIVEGPGDFTPRLVPFALSTFEAWGDAVGWAAATPAPTPLGGYRLDCGTYRITGTAGANAGAVPEPVLEAHRRLHEYALGVARTWWSETATYSGEGWQASAGWAAKAIYLSGAADLLRPWRRLGA